MKHRADEEYESLCDFLHRAEANERVLYDALVAVKLSARSRRSISDDVTISAAAFDGVLAAIRGCE